MTHAMIVSGLAHGLFHLPAIFGTTAYHGEGDPLIIVPLFLGPRSPWPASVTACLAPDDGQRLAGRARATRAFGIF